MVGRDNSSAYCVMGFCVIVIFLICRINILTRDFVLKDLSHFVVRVAHILYLIVQRAPDLIVVVHVLVLRSWWCCRVYIVCRCLLCARRWRYLSMRRSSRCRGGRRWENSWRFHRRDDRIMWCQVIAFEVVPADTHLWRDEILGNPVFRLVCCCLWRGAPLDDAPWFFI